VIVRSALCPRTRYERSVIFLYDRREMADTELRAVLFHGLADHSRLAILAELELGERRVSDLIASSGLTQSNVSKHLACLWECGLVERERRGREIHYRLVAGIAELLASADAVLATTGERVRACPRYGVLRRQAA
jgi:ArsR family transcriptional regulator, cadmium/lead-responsive transcriptional repressor